MVSDFVFQLPTLRPLTAMHAPGVSRVSTLSEPKKVHSIDFCELSTKTITRLVTSLPFLLV